MTSHDFKEKFTPLPLRHTSLDPSSNMTSQTSNPSLPFSPPAAGSVEYRDMQWFCSGSAYAPFNAVVTEISKWSQTSNPSLRFCSGFAYAPFNAVVTEISKWSQTSNPSLPFSPPPEAGSVEYRDKFQHILILIYKIISIIKIVYCQFNA